MPVIPDDLRDVRELRLGLQSLDKYTQAEHFRRDFSPGDFTIANPSGVPQISFSQFQNGSNTTGVVTFARPKFWVNGYPSCTFHWACSGVSANVVFTFILYGNTAGDIFGSATTIATEVLTHAPTTNAQTKSENIFESAPGAILESFDLLTLSINRDGPADASTGNARLYGATIFYNPLNSQ